MERKYYSDERNVQIVISLLKAHGINQIVTSPGTTHMCFVGSVQNDPYFKVYSSVDERSAAYIACGMAAESGNPVVLSCTGATASRNYYSGLTEAYYRKLPIIAITSHQGTFRIGHLHDQNIDRRRLPYDVVKLSVEAVLVKDKNDEHYCEIEVNKAILESMRHGGGPVHINLFTTYSRNFSVQTLPPVQIIKRITPFDKFPPMPEGRKAIFVGSHKNFTDAEINVIDQFCATYDAVVFGDHTSGYSGKYKVEFSLPLVQLNYHTSLREISLLIHIGEVSGDTTNKRLRPQNVWRVNPDGEVRDSWGKLSHVFEMTEYYFFNQYAKADENKHKYLDECLNEKKLFYSQIEELPLSNYWVAQQLSKDLPIGCNIHFGILNSLRSWNYFELPSNVTSNSNVGGFGIDGNISSLIGASLVNPDKIYIVALGDLAFFYDMNALGNRHVGNNVRVLVLNNGRGVEMRNSNSPASIMGESGDLFLAAGGHFGKQSKSLIRHYAEDLGYEYMVAITKEDVLKQKEHFLCPELTQKPIIFEIFVDYKDEDVAYKTISQLLNNHEITTKEKLKAGVKSVIGEKGVNALKKLLK